MLQSGLSRGRTFLTESRISRIVGYLLSLALMLLVVVTALRMYAAPELRKTDVVGFSYFTQPDYLVSADLTTHVLNFIVCGLYVLSTMLLGKWQLSRLSRIFPTLKAFDFLPGSVLGFIPGYLSYVALSRILTLFLPKNVFTIAMLIISVVVILLAVDERIRTWNSSRQKVERRKHITILLIFIGVWLLAFQFVSVHIIGDGALYFLGILNSYASGVTSYKLPIMGQHYDEALYLLPLLGMISKAQRNYLDWFWLLYAVGKTSVILWIYGSLRSILKESLLPFILTAIMFLGYLNPNPLSRYLFTDSAAGIAVSLHMGRAITLAMAFVGVSMLLNSRVAHIDSGVGEKQASPGGNGLIPISIAFVLGLGFTSLTASATFTLGLLALMAAIVKSGAKPMIQSSIYPILLAVGVVGCLAQNNKWAGIVLALLIALGFARIRIKGADFYLLLSKIPKASVVLTFLSGIIIGYLFLGNLFSKRLYEALGMGGSLYEDRGIYATISQFGPNPFLGRYPFYGQGSVYAILELYGLPIFGFALAYAAIRYFKMRSSTGEENVIFLVLLFFSATLFLYAFMNGAAGDPNFWITVWVKTRLVDPWFYLLMTLPLVLASRKKSDTDQNGSLRTPILVASAVYLLIMTVGLFPGGPLGQIIRNAGHLLGIMQ